MSHSRDTVEDYRDDLQTDLLWQSRPINYAAFPLPGNCSTGLDYRTHFWYWWTQRILTLTMWKLLPCQIWQQLHVLRCRQLQTGFLHRTFWSQIQAVLVWVLAGLDPRQCTLWAGFVPWPTVSRALVHREQSEKTSSGSSFLFLRTFWYMWLLHCIQGTASKANAMFQVSVPHVVVEISK